MWNRSVTYQSKRHYKHTGKPYCETVTNPQALPQVEPGLRKLLCLLEGRKSFLQPSISALCVLFLTHPKLCVHPSNGRSKNRHIPVHHRSLERFLLYNFCSIFITSHVSHTLILLLYFLSSLIEYWYKSPGRFAFIIVCTNMVISVKRGEEKQKSLT